MAQTGSASEEATLEEAVAAAGQALKQLLSALCVMFLIAVCAFARYSWALANVAASKMRQFRLEEADEEVDALDLEQPAEQCQRQQGGEPETSDVEQPESCLSCPGEEAEVVDMEVHPYSKDLELREAVIVQQERELYMQAQDIMQRVQDVQEEKKYLEQQRPVFESKLQRPSRIVNYTAISSRSSKPGGRGLPTQPLGQVVAAVPTPGRSRHVRPSRGLRQSRGDPELSVGRSEASVGSSSAPRWR